jgi:hypothetical protein
MLRCLSLILLLATTACTATQLAHGTVDVASTIEGIQTQQTIENFGQFAENRFALPSQAFLTAGTIQIVNSVTPTVTFPLSSMFAKGVIVGTSVTDTSTVAGGGGSLAGTVSWQENFNVLPLIDPFTLRNLSIIYRAVIDVNRYGRAERLREFQVPRAYDRDGNCSPYLGARVVG